MLYTLRYRQNPEGVLTRLIEAETDELAERIGRAWCARGTNREGAMSSRRMYLNAERAVVADATILIPQAPQDVEWTERTAVQRLAEMTEKSEEQVRLELLAGKPEIGPQAALPLEKKGSSAVTKQ